MEFHLGGEAPVHLAKVQGEKALPVGHGRNGSCGRVRPRQRSRRRDLLSLSSGGPVLHGGVSYGYGFLRFRGRFLPGCRVLRFGHNHLDHLRGFLGQTGKVLGFPLISQRHTIRQAFLLGVILLGLRLRLLKGPVSGLNFLRQAVNGLLRFLLGYDFFLWHS